jgi:hypothetical protein
MRRQRYLGRGQIAVCQRSGIKCHASELVRDGRIPSLLVLPEWADPPQPQERPYVPNDLEGAPPWQPSPESMPAPVAPVLVAAIAGNDVELTWTAATSESFLPTEYTVWRATDGAAAVQIGELEIEVDLATGTTTPLEFTDDDVDLGAENVYTVIAMSGERVVVTSNEAEPV